MSSGGFSFGGNTSFGLGTLGGSSGTGGSTGLTMGMPAASSLAATTTTTSGFTLGGSTPASTQQTSLLGGLLGSTNKTSTLTLGTVPTATSALTLGGLGKSTASALPATAKPLNLGSVLPSTAAPASGLMLGAKPETSTSSISLNLGSITGGLAGGIGSGLGTASAIKTATTASRGLGGVDSKTTISSSGNAGPDGKTSDSKTVKETGLPNELLFTVENFKKYVKSQKSVREDIARMTSKQMYRVQEDVATLKQLLSLVSNGLQRNTMSITKLKLESAQELKSAEIAQRTKDTPPGLQYENTAPAEYFQHVVQEFEMRMIMYRQQIEEMESHLMSLQQPSVLTPQELTAVLRKMHESFIALAAQLQVVHEHVKAQKEHYLNYRKVFHGDRTNIFETRKKTVEKISVAHSFGPTPFAGISNATAVAMATALNRTQPSGAPPTLGLNIRPLGTTNPLGGTGHTTGFGTGLGLGTGFGTSAASTTQLQTGFSSFGAANTSAVKPLGSTFGTSSTGGLFGPSAGVNATSTSLFGSPAQPSAAIGGSNLSTNMQSVGFNFAGTSTASPAQQPFQLQKPPAGNKRGKKS